MMISMFLYFLTFLLMLFLEFCNFFSRQQMPVFTKQIQESLEQSLGWLINDDWFAKYYIAWFAILICLLLVSHFKKKDALVPSNLLLVLLCTQAVSLLLLGLMNAPTLGSFFVTVFYAPWLFVIPIAQFIMVIAFGCCIVRSVKNRN